jgi:ATP-binding cassette subfamily F protein uup
VYCLAPDGSIRHLPGGIEQYVQQREDAATAIAPSANAGAKPKSSISGGDARAARKNLARIERAIQKIDTQEAALHEQMAAASTDHELLRELQEQLTSALNERAQLENDWLAVSESLES